MANSPDDLERQGGKWMRAEGNKRKTVDEEQEAEEDMIKKSVQNLKTLETAQAKKELEEIQEVVELAKVEANEEEDEWEKVDEETQFEEEGRK